MQRTTEPKTRGFHFGFPSRSKSLFPSAKRVLVPVTGSSMDHRALELASEIVRSNHGSLYIAYIIEVPRELPLDAPVDAEASVAEAALADMEAFCTRQKCEAFTELLQVRQIGPAVVNEIAERDADLVIIAMDHQRRYGEYTLGDAVPYVLQHAPCAVWVMREPIALDS